MPGSVLCVGDGRTAQPQHNRRACHNGGSSRARAGQGHHLQRKADRPLNCLPLPPQGEGTQIEAAQVFPPDAGTGGSAPAYQSYGAVPGQDEWLFLNITAQYAQRWREQEQRARQGREDHWRTEL